MEDDGRINIASSDDVAAQKAIAIIQELTATPEQDKVYMGRVERITDFGAFIEVMPGVDWPAPRVDTAWPTSATSSKKARWSSVPSRRFAARFRRAAPVWQGATTENTGRI